MKIHLQRQHRPIAALTMAALAMALTACASMPRASISHRSSSSPPSSASSAVGSSASDQTIVATETEFDIALSQSAVSAGTWTIEAKNAGHATHDLVVDGPGVEDQKAPLMSPGRSTELTVTLRRGTYEIYCSVPGHKAAGMDTKLTVS